jgi:alpha-beta hydrolase superfamily lysophospholipase
MTQVPLTFESRGEELVGILSLPEGVKDEAEVGIVFAQSGARGRLGNSFHYPYFSRAFAAAGIPTFRFDPAGIGDSTGRIEGGDMRRLYRDIQTGLFVPDTLAAVEAFTRRVKVRHLLLLGLCGGAVTALLAAPKARRLDGVILLSLPVLLDEAGPAASPPEVPKAYARKFLIANYARKLLSPTAWSRLLSGRSDTRGILRFALASVRPARRAPVDPVGPHPNPRFNPHVVTALDALVERVPLLTVFGEGDAYRHYWEDDLRKVYWKSRPAYAQRIQEHFIPGCNHMFTLEEWQAEAMRRSLAWVQALTGARTGGRTAAAR